MSFVLVRSHNMKGYRTPHIGSSGYSKWNRTIMARQIGDVSSDYIWRALRRHAINLQRRYSWYISTNLEFIQKVAEIVGLYLEPPKGMVVISVEEKPAVQTLKREQGWL